MVIQIFKEGDYYIAYSPELQIATQGKTDIEVIRRFAERLNIYYDWLHKKAK